MSQDITGGGQFAAFEQRPDNKLWLFYKKNRLRKAYVLAYTWHEGRAGALAAFHVALDEVEGTEIENPEDCLVEAGCTVVFVPTKGTDYRIVETTVAMLGADLRELSKKPSVVPIDLVYDPAVSNEAGVVLNGKSESVEVVDELFQSIQGKMQRLKKSATYGKEDTSADVNESPKDECVNCGSLGYRYGGHLAWIECDDCNSDEQISWIMDVLAQLKADKEDITAKYNALVQDLKSCADERVHITQDFRRGLSFAAEKCKREAALLEAHKNTSGLTHHALGRLEAYNAMEEHFRTLSEPRNSAHAGIQEVERMSEKSRRPDFVGIPGPVVPKAR